MQIQISPGSGPLPGSVASVAMAERARSSVSVTACLAMGDVSGLIENVYAALAALGTRAGLTPEKPTGAVSVRASIKPDHLVSMIDGKSYKMLKRHLALNGYTPQSYREAFDLPRDYPMIAATYAEKRRAIAIQIGLGRKAKAAIEPVVTAKPARKPRVKKVLSKPATG